MKMKIVFLIFGIIFGYILSHSGATNHELYAQMFLFEDLHLMILMITAMGIGILGFYIMKKFSVKAILVDNTVKFDKKKMTKHLILGSLLFGIGWGATGTCPGTSVAMLGEGKLPALFTVLGALIGTYLFGIFESKKIDKEVNK